MSTSTIKHGRRNRTGDSGGPIAGDLPYAMKLPEGGTLIVGVPQRWTTRDRGGELLFLPDGVKFLDRVRAMALELKRRPSPGYILTLREAMGMTQAEFARELGVDKLTVSRWERGVLRPSEESAAAIQKLRRDKLRRGVVLAG